MKYWSNIETLMILNHTYFHPNMKYGIDTVGIVTVTNFITVDENVHIIGQGETPHRKYNRLKLGGGHVYNFTSVLDCHGSVNYY
jgi:hypothetical protein